MLSKYKENPKEEINELRQKIIKELRRRDWVEENPEEAAAFEAAKKEREEREAIEQAEADKRTYLREFSWITADEAKAEMDKRMEKFNPWKRNWMRPKKVKK